MHWGEWFGHDINRGYGLKHRQFALFNTGRWKQSDLRLIPSLKVVPTIHTGPFSTVSICVETAKLESNGSAIVPGYMAPEGVIVYLTEAQQYFKYTLKGDQRKRGW
ncbi:hypothetical protein SAMN05421505_11276 [Sinosporangium album]|uniref:Uncharacterized protein n=1 Tax=Sinosporangium album TaxID=504805 RepID=A0A1G8ABX1_9ACTN|nr:hypothetical protein SAMN05421505_11276 [Sinosporangium album]